MISYKCFPALVTVVRKPHSIFSEVDKKDLELTEWWHSKAAIQIKQKTIFKLLSVNIEMTLCELLGVKWHMWIFFFHLLSQVFILKKTKTNRYFGKNPTVRPKVSDHFNYFSDSSSTEFNTPPLTPLSRSNVVNNEQQCRDCSDSIISISEVVWEALLRRVCVCVCSSISS